MKQYNIFEAGGLKVTTVKATCITKACKKFIETLSRPAAWMYKLDSTEQATIKYLLNQTVTDDYIVIAE